MKTSIDLYYADMPNMGDLLNVLIVEEIFGYKVHRKTVLNSEMAAIGSGLQNYTWSNRLKLRPLQRLYSLSNKKVTIWGTGFMYSAKTDKDFFRKNIQFNAVRGNLTKKRVEKILGRSLNIPTGDAGLLASYLFKEPIKKKYKVGIIPHFREQDLLCFSQLEKKFDNVIVIDLRIDPLKVIKQIAQCEVIISSSLHGLIVADSFNIPNQFIVASNDRLRGDGFKFKDYYSSFNLEIEPIDINFNQSITVEEVVKNYQITKEMVDNKKKELIKSFPYEHSVIA